MCCIERSPPGWRLAWEGSCTFLGAPTVTSLGGWRRLATESQAGEGGTGAGLRSYPGHLQNSSRRQLLLGVALGGKGESEAQRTP